MIRVIAWTIEEPGVKMYNMEHLSINYTKA